MGTKLSIVADIEIKDGPDSKIGGEHNVPSLEIWRGEELIATVKDDENVHYALGRVLKKLAK